MFAGVLVIDQCLLERGAGHAIAHAAGNSAEVQALGGLHRRAQQALEPPAQVGGARQVRLGLRACVCADVIARLDQEHGRAHGQRGKELLFAVRVEVEPTIERQHASRILKAAADEHR